MQWQEFHGTTRTGATKVWRVRQDGDTYYVQHGQLGGKMQDKSDRPGDKGKKGTAAYMTPEENCTFHISRQIRLKEEKGYVEMIEGQKALTEHSVKTANVVDLSKPLPKNFCPYKPLTEKKITDTIHKGIIASGKARYTRKRDGECHIFVHHTGGLGWKIYSRRMDEVTLKFPYHLKQLMNSDVPEGTMITGEVCVVNDDGTDDCKLAARFCRSSIEKARRLVAGGEVPEPRLFIFDIMFHGGKDLKNTSYDDRQAILDNFSYPCMLGTPYDGLINHCEVVTADLETWDKQVRIGGWEGLVLVLGSCIPGDKFYTFNGNAARPKGHYKLKLNFSEDCVAFCTVAGNGDDRHTVGSLVLKQRDKDGNWFDCGKAGSGLTRDDGDLDRDVVKMLGEAHGVPFMENDTDDPRTDSLNLDTGFVVEIEYKSRQPDTHKFKFPVIKRIRFDKAKDECYSEVC